MEEQMNDDSTLQKAKRVLNEARERRSSSSMRKISLRNLSRRHSSKTSRYSPISKAETSLGRLCLESYPSRSSRSQQEEKPQTKVCEESRSNGSSEPSSNHHKISKLHVTDSEVAEIMDELKKHHCFLMSEYESSVHSNDQTSLTDSILDFLDNYDNTMKKFRRRRNSILSSKYKDGTAKTRGDSISKKTTKSRTRNVRFDLNVEWRETGEDNIQSNDVRRKANCKQKEIKGILRNSRIYSMSCENKRMRSTTTRNSSRKNL